jgi:hypothetical protein
MEPTLASVFLSQCSYSHLFLCINSTCRNSNYFIFLRFQILTTARLSSGIIRRVVSYNFTDVSEVFAVSIIWATEESCSVNYRTTWRNVPEGSHLDKLNLPNVIEPRHASNC